jgi:hypothetical protein
MFDSGTDALYTAFLSLDLIWRIGLQRRNKKVWSYNPPRLSADKDRDGARPFS